MLDPDAAQRQPGWGCMIHSMTGFGSADGALGEGGPRLAVEIRAVNHRFFNPSLKLPPALSLWEGQVRDLLRRRFSRGHITLSGRLEWDVAYVSGIDEARVAVYVEQLRALAARFGLDGAVDVATVMRLPGVFSAGADRDDAAARSVSGEALPQLLGIVDDAAAQLAAMRRTEGSTIRSYLLEHLLVVERELRQIELRAPHRLVEQHERMRLAVSQLLEGARVDEQRLAQEVALLADRLDVSEELSRFAAHVAAFRAALEHEDPEGVGKRLGFLLQEMVREANTTGSKANDAEMLASVVTIKEELERLREQTENVE